MKYFFGFLIIVIKLFIIFKVTSLLYLTNSDPTNYPMEKLTWWIYFLIFEIWLYITLKDINKQDEED